MKLLYVAFGFLATAAIAYAQIVVAAIAFAIELIEVETGLSILLDLEADIGFASELVDEMLEFNAQTNWAHVTEYVEGFAEDEFGADVFVEHVTPVSLNMVDEQFIAEVQWSQHVEAFGRWIPMDAITSISTQVTVDGEGAAVFQIEGGIEDAGVELNVGIPGYHARWIDDMVEISFGPPIP